MQHSMLKPIEIVFYHLKHEFHQVSWSWISREANCAADAAVKLAKERLCSVNWTNCTSTNLHLNDLQQWWSPWLPLNLLSMYFGVSWSTLLHVCWSFDIVLAVFIFFFPWLYLSAFGARFAIDEFQTKIIIKQIRANRKFFIVKL